MINIIDYVSLGALTGFTFNFHASIKAMSLVVLTTIVFSTFYQWFSGKLKVNGLVFRLLLLLLFLFVGFGPRLLNTLSVNSFLHTSRVPVIAEEQLAINSLDLKDVAEKYKKSLLVWITEPTSAWYPDHKPILPPVLFSLMVLGIIVGFARKNPYLIAVLYVVLALHLSNSALTDIVNGDHRLSPLFPVGPLFIGVGTAFLIDKMNLRSLQNVFAFTLLVVLIYQTTSFFVDQPANKNKDIGDYLSMHTIYFIKENYDLHRSNKLTFIVSPSNFEKYNYLHYKEQYMFFLPTINIAVENREDIDNNEIYIKNNSDSLAREYTIGCGGSNSYYCPANYQNVVIHY